MILAPAVSGERIVGCAVGTAVAASCRRVRLAINPARISSGTYVGQQLNSSGFTTLEFLLHLAQVHGWNAGPWLTNAPPLHKPLKKCCTVN